MPHNNSENIQYPGWEIIRKIGSGSFGTVYEIRREKDGRCERAALKVISIPHDKSEIRGLRMKNLTDRQIAAHYAEFKDRVINEYETMKRLQCCENIVSCHRCLPIEHSGGVGWDVMLEMELLTPLPTRLASGFSEADVLDLGIDLCRALIACRREGIIHRDIKPDNIFVSNEGCNKLGDFGIARELGDTVQSATKGIGTYDYMAPEVKNSNHYSNNVDIYSLGLVMFMLLNEGRLPFEPLPPARPRAGYDYTEVRFNGTPIPKPAHGEEALKQIILKACAFDPKNRYQTAEEMLRDLEVVGKGGTPSGLTAQIKERKETYSASPDEHRNKTTAAGRESAHKGSRTQGTVSAFTGSREWETEPPKPKKWPVILAGLAAVLAVTAWGYFNIPHNHKWQPATCTVPKTCSICGKTEGEALGHQWVDATERAPKTCTVCGATEGIAIGHDWEEPTYEWSDDYRTVVARRVCSLDQTHIETETVFTTGRETKAATCSTKGETTYTTDVFRNNAFSIQTKTVADIALTEHTWKEADCIKPKTCSACGKTEGEPLGHDWMDATYYAPKTCKRCSITEGEPKKPVYTVGDTVFFGKYEQNNTLSDGKETIEWLVLDVQDGRALLISKYALERRLFHKSRNAIAWNECTLRTWLNEDFLRDAFSAEEKKQILTTAVTADSNPRFNTNPGSETNDKLFLLSIDEVEKYFSSDRERQCRVTEYYEERGYYVNSNGNCWWWLRTPGMESRSVARVSYDGSIDYSGYYSDLGNGVRPAMWIDPGN